MKSNDMSDRVSVVKCIDTGSKFPFEIIPDNFIFSMTNPPFYSSREEMANSAKLKQSDPIAVCTGNNLEMCTAGGELEFMKSIYRDYIHILENTKSHDDSRFRQGVRAWITAQMGFKENRSKFREFLQDQVGIGNGVVIRTEDMTCGHTTRYLIAFRLL